MNRYNFKVTKKKLIIKFTIMYQVSVGLTAVIFTDLFDDYSKKEKSVKKRRVSVYSKLSELYTIFL